MSIEERKRQLDWDYKQFQRSDRVEILKEFLKYEISEERDKADLVKAITNICIESLAESVKIQTLRDEYWD